LRQQKQKQKNKQTNKQTNKTRRFTARAQVVKLLLDNGMDPGAPDPQTGDSPLHISVRPSGAHFETPYPTSPSRFPL
jgi:hypothetical protein